MSALAAPPTPAAARAPSTDDFLRLAQTVMRALHSTDLDSWCAVDLTMPQLKALFLARGPDGISHGDIARALGVGLSTVTGVVDRLVDHGLVERRTHADDRRLSYVVATSAGNDLIDRLWASRRDHLAEVLTVLSEDERATLQAALQHLAALLGEKNA